ncbi:MAG: hypothetical protein ACLGJB_03705 [Blastocatellia bacterium]
MKHLVNLDGIEPVNHQVENQDYPGSLMRGAPQPTITTANNGSIPTGSGGDYVDASALTILNNMRTRINELETVLRRLHLLK